MTHLDKDTASHSNDCVQFSSNYVIFIIVIIFSFEYLIMLSFENFPGV